MDLKQIECFIAVATELSFTVAADKMYLTQPSLSRHIKNLEEELGVELFYRDKKNVELTDIGIQLLGSAREINGSVQELIYLSNALKTGKKGKLRLGYQGSASAVVPVFLRKFTSRYPEISISIDQYSAYELVNKIKDGELDMIIAFDAIFDQTEDMSSFEMQEIYNDEMAMFTSEEIFDELSAKRLASGVQLNLSDFSKYPMLMIAEEINPGYHKLLNTIFSEHGIIPKYPPRQPTLVNTLMLLIKSNLGVSLLPKNTILDGYHGCRFFKLSDVNVSLPIISAWNKHNFNPCLMLMHEIIGEAIHDMAMI